MTEPQFSDIAFEATVDTVTLKNLQTENEGNKVRLIRVTLDSEGPAQTEIVVHQSRESQDAVYPGSAYKIGVPVKVKLGYADTLEEVFDGLATRVDALFPEDDSPSYRVTGYDRLHLLSRGRSSDSWQSVTYSDIVSAVAGNFGLGADVDATSETYDHVAMNGETYFAFLQGVARRTGRLLGCKGTQLLFKEPVPGGSVATLTYAANLKRARFTSSSTGQVNKVWVFGYDPEQNQQIIGKATSSDIVVTKGGSQWGAELVSSKFNQGGDYKNQLWITDAAVKTQSGVDALAKAVLNDIAEKFSRVEAEVEGDPKIKPHETVTFEGVTSVFEGDWYVISAVHEYVVQGKQKKGGYRTKFVARRGGWTPP
jgi:phage protein D